MSLSVIDSKENVIDKITIDVYNKKVIIRGTMGTEVVFKCSTINELIDLKQKCAIMLNTENFTYR